MQHKLFLIAMGWLLLAQVQGQITTPKYSNEFLTLGVGARGLGMSGAQTAITNDVTAAYWNPAGLMRLSDRYEVGLMHSSYFGGIANYDYLGLATRLDSQSVVGFSVVRLGVDNIPDTRFLIDENGRINYDNVGSFAEASYAFLFSYARAFPLQIKTKNDVTGQSFRRTVPLHVGANVKVIYRKAGIFTQAWGFGLDVGAQMTLNRWQLGVMGKDITGTFNAWSFNTDAIEDVFIQTGNAIPVNAIELTLPRLTFGVGRNFKLWKELSLLGSLALESTFDGRRNTLLQSNLVSINPQFGLELGYRQMVFVRGGIGNFQEVEDFEGKPNWQLQPNFGIGFRFKQFIFDYALTSLGQQLDLPYSHIFSLRISFNQKDIAFLQPTAQP